MNYAIVAPKYESNSAGIHALYLLNEHLKHRGQISRIFTPGSSVPTKDEIVIYPESFVGNMYRHPQVVRWFGQSAGHFGQDKDFPESEMLFYWTEEFCLNGRTPENLLTIPPIREERFRYHKLNRSGSAYLVVKYEDYFKLKAKDIPPDSIRINKFMDLSDLFSKIRTLITYDNSVMNIEAAMAGVELEFRFNEKFTKPFSCIGWDNVNLSYQFLKQRYFNYQLPEFIKRTQERFS